MTLTIAIDFGGVLSITQEMDDILLGHKSTDINIPGSIDALINMKKKGHKLFINSFCGKARAIQTRSSIEQKVPGVFDGLYFVKNKKFKGYITQFIGANVMIDDTLEVLETIREYDSECHLIWFTGDLREKTGTFLNNVSSANGIVMLDSWDKIVMHINSLTNVTPRIPDFKMNIDSIIYTT